MQDWTRRFRTISLFLRFPFRQDGEIDQIARDILGGLDKEVPASHCRVKHIYFEHGLQLVRISRFVGYGSLQHRPHRMLHYVLYDVIRCIIGTACLALPFVVDQLDCPAFIQRGKRLQPISG